MPPFPFGSFFAEGWSLQDFFGATGSSCLYEPELRDGRVLWMPSNDSSCTLVGLMATFKRIYLPYRDELKSVLMEFTAVQTPWRRPVSSARRW